ncbi:hypothetical protein FNV43_RR25471 [Rhamnella rubrinervis]|uniref:Leucine-rich repeat-containing N-terminal plant-type domain-containing protein n=1 Tax=Rhamnella rubrinervis TaxID=2594499 RepID=A0A8K0GRM8_9ROSA|nr:hypothetical protein FNV43_RR25471 [Rhamnella rubrinervis]
MPMQCSHFAMTMKALRCCNSRKALSSPTLLLVLKVLIPRSLQWNSETRNCCSWDGVECDEQIGNVISLDLTSSFLFGSINSNSTLFSLRHIRMLSLADNNFNYSQIPAAITQLSGLAYLNLSGSYFYGQVPFEISNLHMLSYLDLSYNYDPDTSKKFLQLQNPSLKTLVSNLTRLEVLNFRYINISSEVPGLLSNFTSLRLPSSIDKLDSLKILGITGCNFSGAIPHSLGKLANITYLGLSKNNFIGHIPSSFQNLTHLTALRLHHNKITGSLGNLTKIEILDLSENKLEDPIAQSVSKLMNLEYFLLAFNSLSGFLEFDMFLSTSNLATTICHWSLGKQTQMRQGQSSNISD